MAHSLCPVCHASPCYGICSTQDPYAGRPWEEHCDYEAGRTDDPHGFAAASRQEALFEALSDLDEQEAQDMTLPAPAPVADSAPPVPLDPNDIWF
jgi:hypothetical protein